MNVALVVLGVLSGLLAALLASPLGLGWLPAQVDPTWPHVLPLLPCLLAAILMPAPLIWAGAKAAQGAASRRDALLRGAVSGGFGGVVLFLGSGGPVAGILALRPGLAALARAPLQGLDLGVPIAQSVIQVIALCSALWLVLPAIGAGLGMLGAWRWRAERAGPLRAPGLASVDASLGALLIAGLGAFTVPPIAVAMRGMVKNLGALGAAVQDAGGQGPAHTWAMELPSYLTYSATTVAFLACLRGTALRRVPGQSRPWDVAMGFLSLGIWLGFLFYLTRVDLAFCLRAPFLTLTLLGAVGVRFANRAPKDAVLPMPGAPAESGWMLATATAMAWFLSLAIHIGLAAGFGIVALIAPLSDGPRSADVGARTLEGLVQWMPACGLLLLPTQAVPVLMFLGVPLGVRAFLRRRPTATSSLPSP